MIISLNQMRKNYLQTTKHEFYEVSPPKYSYMLEPKAEKENHLRHTNTQQSSRLNDDPNPNLNNKPHYTLSNKNQKSTTSTHLPKSSVENLYIHRLESQILELQKTLDEQQFEMQTLSEQSNFYMNTCETQKETIINMNIDALRNQYQEQIRELLTEREKMQEIVSQLRQDYEEAYEREEEELRTIRCYNDEYSKEIEGALNRKKALLTLLSNKNEMCNRTELEVREGEERLDELRNIQRKFTVALRELERMKRGEKN